MPLVICRDTPTIHILYNNWNAIRYRDTPAIYNNFNAIRYRDTPTWCRNLNAIRYRDTPTRSTAVNAIIDIVIGTFQQDIQIKMAQRKGDLNNREQLLFGEERLKQLICNYRSNGDLKVRHDKWTIWRILHIWSDHNIIYCEGCKTTNYISKLNWRIFTKLKWRIFCPPLHRLNDNMYEDFRSP